jgi:competence protein ComEC
MTEKLKKIIIYISSGFVGILFFLAVLLTANSRLPSFEKIFGVFLEYGYGNFASETANFGMSVHFMSVGHADSIYIKCEGRNILIDAGDKEETGKVLDYLKKQNVWSLDMIVVTHPHKDHIGQMYEVIENIEIKDFVMSEIPGELTPHFSVYKKMLSALERKNLKIHKIRAKESFLMENLEIEILGPGKIYEKMNNNSVVMRAKYGDNSFLFMGDAEKEAESDMLKSGADLRANVLKVGHHGSNTSTTKKFLREVNPEYAVISVGKSRHNLPKTSVIRRLKESGCKVYRTDVDGTVVFMTNGNGVEVLKERGVA